MNKQYNDVTEILTAGCNTDPAEIKTIMEDAENPIRRKTLDKLYDSLRVKGHVDFGHIAKSEGSIYDYTGYKSMIETLHELNNLGKSDIQTTKEYRAQVNIVQNAVNNLSSMAPLYKLAFIKKLAPIILEYNSFVAACVEATTSLLYNFIDYVRNPASGEVQQVIKNTNRRGDLFYIEQLRLFNISVTTGSYRKYLTTVVNHGTDYFLGIDDGMVVGSVALVTTVALGIVPITRKLIYTYQDIRRKLSDSLELQAYYLELNQSILEAKETLPAEKKEKILKRQAELRLKFLRLAEKIRVESKRNEELSKKVLEKDNRMLTVDGIRGDIDDSDFSVV